MHLTSEGWQPADPEGFWTAVSVLMDAADRDGAPMHLALPIAAMRLSMEDPPEFD